MVSRPNLLRGLFTDGRTIAPILTGLFSVGFTLLKALDRYVMLDNISYAWALLPITIWLLYAYYCRWSAYDKLAEQINNEPVPDTTIKELFDYIEIESDFFPQLKEITADDMHQIGQEVLDKAIQDRLNLWGRLGPKKFTWSIRPLMPLDHDFLLDFNWTYSFLSQATRNRHQAKSGTYPIFNVMINEVQMKALWPKRKKRSKWKFWGIHGIRKFLSLEKPEKESN